MNKNFFLFSTLFILIVPFNVKAYIDPGTGSFIAQVIIAAVLGMIFYFKSFFRKIKNLFIGKKKEIKEKNEDCS